MFSRILPVLRASRSRVHLGILPVVAVASNSVRSSARCFATVNEDGSHPDFQKKTAQPKKDVNYDEAIKSLQALVDSHTVVVFMKGEPDAPQCGFSGRTVDALDSIGLYEYTFVNVLEHEVAREAVKKMTDWPTIPQVFIKGEFVGGCDIIEQMAKSGELTKTLEEAGVKLEK